ncbi:MAG: GHKL domain-containing protein [Ruminococcaceae bacterium]|nr:GHKL domain-containing protein [Oscillospiraceae bacterium]
MNPSSILWTVIELSATLFEILLILTLLSHWFGRRFANPLYYAGVAAAMTGIVYLLNILAAPALMTVGIVFALSLLVSLTVYNGKLRQSLLLLLIYNILWGGSEFGVLIGLSQVLGSPENFALPTMQRLVGLVSTKLVLFILIRLLIRFRQRNVSRLSWPYYLALLAFPGASVFTIISLDLMWQKRQQSINVQPFAAAAVIALLFANLLVYYLFDRLQLESEERARLQLFERQIELEKKSLNRAERQHTELRRLAHDLNKIITPISVYARQGNIEQIEESLATIRHSIAENAASIHSGNAFLDALLAERMALALQQNTNIRTQIALDPGELPIPAEDFCVMLGNALDNAIEACARLPESKVRQIHLMIRQEKGMLQLMVKNPLPEPLIILGEEYLSSKRNHNRRGIGIDSMRRIVKRYRGSIDIDTNADQFTLTMILPI